MNRKVADLPIDQFELLRREGFWCSEEEPHLPHPSDFVDESWDVEERRKVIAYLGSSYLAPIVQAGPSWCRMGCRDLPADIGTQDLTDGTWRYPEGLVHYLRNHGVKPSQAFLEHVRRNEFRVPELSTIED